MLFVTFYQSLSLFNPNRDKVVVTVAPTYTWGYFFGYNMIGSFLITLLVPGLTLGTFNTLIWRRLQQIWRNRSVSSERHLQRGACLNLPPSSHQLT